MSAAEAPMSILPDRAAPGMRRQRAIVLGAEHPRAVAFIQSLGRAGVEVLVADPNPSPIGFYSRYAARTFAIERTDAAVLGLLDRLAPEGGLIIATNDQYMVLVSKHYPSLARSFILTTPPWETLERMIDLPRFYAAARSYGMRTPE